LNPKNNLKKINPKRTLVVRY